MSKKSEFAPAAVGRPLKCSQIRADLGDLSHVDAKSEIDLHIVRLLALNPSLKVRFRNQELASLDISTTEALLDDINSVLGIRPLRKRKT